MAEDMSFKKMMESREASKERGLPAGFQKSQLSNGAKPGWMGRDKNWPMPKDIPKAKTEGDTKSKDIKKAADIGEAKDAEDADETDPAKKKEYEDAFNEQMDDPLKGLSKLTSSRKSAFGTEMKPFREMMFQKKAGTRARQKMLAESEKVDNTNIEDDTLRDMANGYNNDPNVNNAIHTMVVQAGGTPAEGEEWLKGEDPHFHLLGPKMDLGRGELERVNLKGNQGTNSYDAQQNLEERGHGYHEALNMSEKHGLDGEPYHYDEITGEYTPV